MLKPEQLIRMMYILKQRFYEDGDIVAKQDQECNKFIIVENGCVEVQANFDGNFFAIDRLFRGSVINFRNVLT